MAEIKVPMLGESVKQATVAKWFRAVGDVVEADEPLVELETEKVALEVPAPVSGRLTGIIAAAGTSVEVGALLGVVTEAGHADAPAIAMPPASAGPAPQLAAAAPAAAAAVTRADRPGDERVKMTRLRHRIAERLKEAQNTAAMLTTFNEADMSAVNALRAKYREEYERRHGVKLGYLGFFIKAATAALKEIPVVNAEIQGDDIVYKHHYDIGVAVSTPHGLVVPVVRDADRLSFAEVEQAVAALAAKARDGKLAVEDLQGGTFTITNGGVFGSLLSTPILNPPQSGILGMHKIQNRPVAIGDAVVVRPMMYLALSYDHRIVDGREAVTFLVRIKDAIEDPERLLLGV